MDTIKQRPRLDWLDTLRAIAAVSVVLAHLIAYYRNSLHVMDDFLGRFLSAVFVDYLDFGKFGVVLFFCISGYIIPRSIRGNGIASVRDFALSRFFRLYPLYWLSIPLGVLLPWDMKSDGFSEATIIANITMVQNFLGFENVIGAYWTLHIEIAFYVICAMIALVGLSGRPAYAALASIFFTIASLLMAYARYSMDLKLPVAIPMALALMFWASVRSAREADGDRDANMTAERLALGVFVVSLLPICFLAYNKDMGFDESWYRYFISYGAALIFFYFGSTSWRIDWRPATFVGLISYSIYLMHPTVFAVLDRTGLQSALFGAIGRVPTIAISVALVIVVSTVTYYLVEKPFDALGKSMRPGRLQPTPVEPRSA